MRLDADCFGVRWHPHLLGDRKRGPRAFEVSFEAL